MSLSSESGRSTLGAREPQPDPAFALGGQTDALAVLAEDATVVHAYPLPGSLAPNAPGAVIPVVQAAAAAAGGFVAGAALVGLVHRRQRRVGALGKGRRAGRGLGRGARASRGAPKAAELIQIVGSRSLLVDVHLLGDR